MPGLGMTPGVKADMATSRQQEYLNIRRTNFFKRGVRIGWDPGIVTGVACTNYSPSLGQTRGHCHAPVGL